MVGNGNGNGANGNGNGRGPGRPSKLTPEVLEQLVEALETGASNQDASESVGISRHTFRDWMEKGEASKTGQYVEFYQRMSCARARGNIELLKDLRKTTKGKLAILKYQGYNPVEKVQADVEHSGVVSQIVVKRLEVSEDDRQE